MWARLYFFLALIRLYFALQPSYLHPDEQFQGPEVIAGRVFGYPVHQTWEFTSDSPVRSVFPLWPVYGLPMLILRWLWEGSGSGLITPAYVFWTLRVIMFVLSFVLEDWAIHDLVESPRQRQVAMLLVASSYVTWSWQVHTFSNAIETIVVLWSLVLIKRIIQDKETRSPLSASFALAFLVVFGVFTRITFPAFLVVPGFQMIPTFRQRPRILMWLISFCVLLTFAAISVDTIFYRSPHVTFRDLFFNPVIAPLNSLAYNTQPENLALHGTHPFYQHLVANLPQLLGPAFPLLFFSARRSIELVCAASAVVVLSLFSHQEARFLLPAVPLILSSVRIPHRIYKPWIAAWILFNTIFGLLMGAYHQGGVVPAQIYLETQHDVTEAYWWKTYSPPTWLLNGRNTNMATIDLMGLQRDELAQRICKSDTSAAGRVLVAPHSATFLDQFKGVSSTPDISLRERWVYRNHLNLDDLDFGDDGVMPTLARVIGRRGLKIWNIECPR